MAARDELVVALAERSPWAAEVRGRILDEFTAVTGLHRKHAMRFFRAGRPTGDRGRVRGAGSMMMLFGRR